jgi:hypothetical protein
MHAEIPEKKKEILASADEQLKKSTSFTEEFLFHLQKSQKVY